MEGLLTGYGIDGLLTMVWRDFLLDMVWRDSLASYGGISYWLLHEVITYLSWYGGIFTGMVEMDSLVWYGRFFIGYGMEG